MLQVGLLICFSQVPFLSYSCLAKPKKNIIWSPYLVDLSQTSVNQIIISKIISTLQLQKNNKQCPSETRRQTEFQIDR